VAHFVETEPADEWLVTVSAKPSEGGTVDGDGCTENDWVEVTRQPMKAIASSTGQRVKSEVSTD
jgi:hypothetical protein